MIKKDRKTKIHIYHLFLIILLIFFFLSMFFLNKNRTKKWTDKEIEGVITNVAIKNNDKYTYLMLDTIWYRFGTRNPDFKNNCYINHILIKRKGENLIWIINNKSNTSISYSVHGGSSIEKNNDIYWIEKEKIIWDKQ